MEVEREQFIRVWDRVRGAGPEKESEESILRELTAIAVRENRRLRALAGRTRRGGILTELAREREAELRGLQSALFLLTGDSVPERGIEEHPTGVLAGLRLCWAEERETARLCRAAGKGGVDYARLRQSAERRGEKLAALIAEAIQ